MFSEDKKTDLIGEAHVDLSSVIVPGGGTNDVWQGLTCKGKYAGEVRLELTYYDARPKPERASRASNPATAEDGTVVQKQSQEKAITRCSSDGSDRRINRVFPQPNRKSTQWTTSCRLHREPLRYHQMLRPSNLVSMARPDNSTRLHPTTSGRSITSNLKIPTTRCNTHSLNSSHNYRQRLEDKSCLKALHQ